MGLSSGLVKMLAAQYVKMWGLDLELAKVKAWGLRMLGMLAMDSDLEMKMGYWLAMGEAWVLGWEKSEVENLGQSSKLLGYIHLCCWTGGHHHKLSPNVFHNCLAYYRHLG